MYCVDTTSKGVIYAGMLTMLSKNTSSFVYDNDKFIELLASITRQYTLPSTDMADFKGYSCDSKGAGGIDAYEAMLGGDKQAMMEATNAIANWRMNDDNMLTISRAFDGENRADGGIILITLVNEALDKNKPITAKKQALAKLVFESGSVAEAKSIMDRQTMPKLEFKKADTINAIVSMEYAYGDNDYIYINYVMEGGKDVLKSVEYQFHQLSNCLSEKGVAMIDSIGGQTVSVADATCMFSSGTCNEQSFSNFTSFDNFRTAVAAIDGNATFEGKYNDWNGLIGVNVGGVYPNPGETMRSKIYVLYDYKTIGVD